MTAPNPHKLASLINALALSNTVPQPHVASSSTSAPYPEPRHSCFSIIYPLATDFDTPSPTPETCKACAFHRENEHCQAEKEEVDDLLQRKLNRAQSGPTASTSAPPINPTDSAPPSAAPPQSPVANAPSITSAELSPAGPARLYPFEAKDYFHVVASDGGGFFVARSFLLRHFAFFADFELFPRGPEENGTADVQEKVEMRELPAASTKGLHLLLYTIEAIEEMSFRRTLPQSQTAVWTHPLILARLPDAFRIANAYDASSFAPAITDALPSTPWYRFLVAALASDEAGAKTASTTTLPLHIITTPPEVTSLLMKHAGAYLWRLRKLHMEKKKSYRGLRSGWSHAFPIHDKNPSFGRKCRGKPMGKVRCGTYDEYDGDFEEFRKDAAEVAFTKLKKNTMEDTCWSDFGHWRLIAEELDDHIECGVCAARIKMTFEVVWRNWTREWRPNSI